MCVVDDLQNFIVMNITLNCLEKSKVSGNLLHRGNSCLMGRLVGLRSLFLLNVWSTKK